MIKKWLGIRELEKNLKQFKHFLKNYSDHTKNLYSHQSHHHNRISHLERKHYKIDEMERKMQSMFDLIEGIIYRLEEMEQNNIDIEQVPVKQKTPEAYEEVAEEVYESPVKKEIQIGDRDKILLQILHQNAAINRENGISTKKVYENLPFSITQRGLRKKLKSLKKDGLISGVKKGRRLVWFVKTGELARVKSIISEPKKKKRNRN